MKIILSTQKKDSFEAEVDPSATALDLKKLVIDHFGYSEDALPKTSMVVKQVVIKDDAKTVADLDIVEGSNVYFFIPTKFNPNQTSGKAQSSTPSASKPSPEKNQSPLPVSESKPQSPFPLSNNNKPIQTNASRIAELNSRPKPQSSLQNNFRSNSNNYGFLNSFQKANSQADPEKMQQLMEMGYDERHASVFLRASSNDMEIVTAMITNRFYEDETNFNRLEQYINGQLNMQEMEIFQRELIQSEAKQNGMGQKLVDKSIQCVKALTGIMQLAQIAQKTSKTRQANISNGYTNIFNDPPKQTTTTVNTTNTNRQQQYFQELARQMKNLNEQKHKERQNMLQNTMSFWATGATAFQYLKKVKNQPPEQFVNPFIELRQKMIEQNYASNPAFNAYDIASRFNRDQIIFLSDMIPPHKFEEIVSILDATDGDIESARAILNSK